MKKLKLFLACMLMTIFSIGQVWATNFELVNNVLALEDGAHYVIGTAASGSAIFMATTEYSDNRKATDAITITAGVIQASNSVLVLELVANNSNWKLLTTNYAGTDGYLYNAESGTGNKCFVGATEREFTIAFNGDAAVITAQGGNSRNILRWNSGSSCFACYGSGQSEVYLFKEVASAADPYTVSFNTGAGNPEQADIAETAGGAGITLPAGPTPACSPTWSFAGWAEAAVASETTTAPTLLAAGATYNPTDNVTLYAVYKRTESGGGESGTVTITRDSENFPTAYGDANTFTEYTLEGYKFKIQQVYATGNGDNKKMQWRASGNSSGTGTIYNTQTYPAKISSIVLTYHSSDGNMNHTLKVGNTENPTGGTEITGTTLNGVETFDCSSANADYFVLANGTNAGYTISFAINYGAASTTYYLSAPTCSTPSCSTPVIAGTTPFLGSSEVTITCGTDGAAIYYTTNGDEPTSGSTLYEGAFSITEACTVKAIAIKDGYDNSAVASKAFEKIVPLTTMDEIFSAASSAGNYYITFSNAWVVTGVSTNGKNVYISDGTKGMILYNNSANMELAVGNTLSGTVQRSLKLYNGAAELDAFTTEGLTKGTADLPAVQVLDAAGIEALSGVNTGSLIKISGAATQSGTKYYVAGVQLYNALSTAYTNPTADKNYYVTGVYAQYNTTKEVMPRSAEDVEEMKYQLNYILPAQGTLSIKQNETLVSSGTKWVEGTEFTLSSTVPSDDYKAGVYTVTDWGEPANDVTADVLSGNTLTMPKYNVIVTVAFAEKAEATAISWSNSGAAVSVHMGATNLPTLTKGEFTVTCNSSDENVATVDNDGVVTMVGAGTTTISAVFAGDDDYKAKTVSYELTVLPDFYITGTAVGGWDSDKVPVAGTSYTIKNLAAGSYKLKITIDGTWGTAKGFSDLTASEVIAGLYNDNDGNICFTLKAAGDVVVTYTGEVYKLAGDFEPQAVKVKGGWDSWTEHAMTLSDDKKSASVTVALPAAENVEFGIQINTDDFRANGYNYHRGYTGTAGITGNTGNMKLTSDIAGDYTFTWTFGTNAMNITFPLKEAGLSWNGVDALNRAWAYREGKTYTLPTLLNPHDLSITYSSDDGGTIISINETTGAIELKSEGVAHVTATSAATSEYKAGSATYTLYVCGITSISLGGEAEKLTYEYGDAFDRTGLTATLHFNNGGTDEDVTELATWTYDKETITSGGSVHVTVSYLGQEDDDYVYNVKVATHAVTWSTPEHGILEVLDDTSNPFASGTKFRKGSVITVNPTAANGYELATLTANGVDIKSTKSFTIGTEDVTIEATFAEKSSAPISWGTSSATGYTVGKTATLPTLSNESELAVSYSSTDPEVATINASTGVVTIQAAGATTISATYVGTPESAYKTTVVNYELTVLAPQAVVITGEAKTTYENGDNFSFEGLGAKAVYAENDEYEIPANEILWTATPLSIESDRNITVKAEWEGLTSAAKIVAVTVIKHTVTIEQPEHGTIVVMNDETEIASGDKLPYLTALTIEVIPDADYKVDTVLVNGHAFDLNYNPYLLQDQDITITATLVEKDAAPISWSAPSAEARYGEPNSYPTLVNPNELEVSYESTNEAAATIAADGTITLVGNGETVIKAIFAGDETYKSKTVEYTLSVSAAIVTITPSPLALDLGDVPFGDEREKYGQSFHLTVSNLYTGQYNQVKIDFTGSAFWTAGNNYITDNDQDGVIDVDVTIVPSEYWWSLSEANALGEQNTTITLMCTGSAQFEDVVVGTVTMTVVPSIPTALDNTEAEQKAVKTMENGVLIIRRGDKSYNAQGKLIK